MRNSVPLLFAVSCTAALFCAVFLASGEGEPTNAPGLPLQAAALRASTLSPPAQGPQADPQGGMAHPAPRAPIAGRASELQDPFQSGRSWSAGTGPSDGLSGDAHGPTYADPQSEPFQQAMRRIRADEERTVIDPPLQLTQPAALHANPDAF